MKHELKTWPRCFKALADETKTFDVRKNDRGFEEGDVLYLKEWDHHTEQYTGRQVKARVTYILPGGEFGIEHGYCVLGIKPYYFQLERKQP